MFLVRDHEVTIETIASIQRQIVMKKIYKSWYEETFMPIILVDHKTQYGLRQAAIMSVFLPIFAEAIFLLLPKDSR